MSRRCRGRCWAALGGVLLGAAAVVGAPPARACGGLAPAPLGAFPLAGAADVPPTSSIVVVAGPGSVPPGLSLEAGGQPVPLPTPQTIGIGRASGQPAGFFRLPGPLLPSTTYVLRVTEPEAAAPRELTRFTTLPSYEKQPGVAPRIDRLRLWRVRYPLSQIGAGGCVFDQYHGYIELEYQDGSLPGTPAAEVIGLLNLRPENGTFQQTFVFAGARFQGHQPPIPEGGLPHPAKATWRPELAPDRRYCVDLQLVGRNDLAIESPRSNTLCTDVINVDLSGGESASPDGGATDAQVGDAGSDGDRDGEGDAGDGGVPSGVPTDAEQRGGGTIERESRGGCAVGDVGARPAAERRRGPVVVLLSLVIGGLIRRPGSAAAKRNTGETRAAEP